MRTTVGLFITARRGLFSFLRGGQPYLLFIIDEEKSDALIWRST